MLRVIHTTILRIRGSSIKKEKERELSWFRPPPQSKYFDTWVSHLSTCRGSVLPSAHTRNLLVLVFAPLVLECGPEAVVPQTPGTDLHLRPLLDIRPCPGPSTSISSPVSVTVSLKQKPFLRDRRGRRPERLRYHRYPIYSLWSVH